MIRPTKHMDLNICTLSIAASILSVLQQNNAIPLEELDETIQTRVGSKAQANFIPALNLLYLLGKVEYDDENDAIVYQTGVSGG